MKLLITYGTRPEIIKLANIMKICEKDDEIEPIYIHSGQHYSYYMNECFLHELNLPSPTHNLEIGSGTQAYQIGTGLVEMEKIFKKYNPDFIIAQGDTNTVFSASLSSVKIHINFGHVESGIRSFDRRMSEEINRVLTDQISDLLFTPTSIAVENLRAEGRNDGIYLTGNTIVEAATDNLKIAESSDILNRLDLKNEEYIVITAHRAENVDNKERLKNIIDAFHDIDELLIYPIHPRTLKQFDLFGLKKRIENIKHLKLIEPLGYFDFLKLCAKSKLIITDSGGIQEECTIYKKPVIIIRDNTERPEILNIFGWLTGCNKNKILSSYNYITEHYNEIKNKMNNLKSPFGDGTASEKIIDILKTY